MKKIILICALALCCFCPRTYAQTDTFLIGQGQFAISGNTYSFFQTIEAVTWNRSIYLYPRQTQTLRGIAAPITAFQLFRDVTRVTTVTPVQGKLLGNCRARVWFANVTQTDWADIKTWTQAQALNPTLVFDGDIKAIVDSTTGWKTFPLSSPFRLDSVKNLAIFTEYLQDAAAIPQIFWTYDSTSVKPIDSDNRNFYSSLQFRFCHKPFSRTDLPVDTFTGSNIRHPQIRFLVRRVPNATNEITFVTDWKLFPNPSKSELTLQFEARETTVMDFFITNMNGIVMSRRVLQPILGQQQLKWNIEDLPAGNYFFTAQTADKGVFTTNFLKIE